MQLLVLIALICSSDSSESAPGVERPCVVYPKPGNRLGFCMVAPMT